MHGKSLRRLYELIYPFLFWANIKKGGLSFEATSIASPALSDNNTHASILQRWGEGAIFKLARLCLSGPGLITT